MDIEDRHDADQNEFRTETGESGIQDFTGRSHEAIKSLAAFATAGGGKVIFGVRPDGTRAGVDIGRNSLEQFASQIRQNMHPALYPSMKEIEEDSKTLLVVEVAESATKPVWAYNIAYKRVGRAAARPYGYDI